MNLQARILALDVGDRTCGVAITDPLGITAQPIDTLRYKNLQERKKVFSDLLQIIKDKTVHKIVIGLPLNMNGTEGPQSKKVKDFIEALKNFIAKKEAELIQSLEWIFWDERLSTSGAERSLIAADVSRAKRKKVIDKMAAVFILQGYLAATSSMTKDDSF